MDLKRNNDKLVMVVAEADSGLSWALCTWPSLLGKWKARPAALAMSLFENLVQKPPFWVCLQRHKIGCQ